MNEHNAPSDPRGERSAQAIQHIGELAVQLCMASTTIDYLYRVSGDIHPIVTNYGPDSMTGNELDPAITSLKYVVDHVLGVLQANFTPDVHEALRAAGYGPDDDDDDDFDDPDDDPDDDTPDAPVGDERFAEKYASN
jgi:hypothetical protein